MKYIKANLGENEGSFPIAIVVSLFNRDLTQVLQDGAIKRLMACGMLEEDILVVEVPGAIEIPIAASKLAQTKQYGAVITLGVVIRGETTHYDYVCQQVSYGCQRVALLYDMPVIFGVLTVENESQAWERLGGKHGHKGIDAADSAMAMYRVLQLI